MKIQAHNKLYRDQSLLKDISFLLIATSFVMAQGFGMTWQTALLYAPLVTAGAFAALLVIGYTVLFSLKLLERLEMRLGLRRGAKS